MNTVPQASAADLQVAHGNLMAAYSETLREADGVDAVNRAFLYHVVRVSADEAYNRLCTHFNDNKVMVSETKEFATEVAKKDQLAKALSLADENKTTIYGFIGSSAVAGGGALSLISSIAHAGNVVGQATHPIHSSVPLLVARFLGSGVAAKMAQGYWDNVVALYNYRTQAHGILAKTLDAPENTFFKLTLGNPPGRVTMSVIGPIGAAVLIVIGALILWFLFNALAAAY